MPTAVLTMLDKPYTIVILLLFVLYGWAIGSFLNVCIYRLPLGLSVIGGRSFCPSCHHQLAAKDLVPIFSYLALGGKCRYCKGNISPRYAGVELLNGILYGCCFLRFGLSLQAILACLFLSVLIVVSLIDWDTREVPDFFHIIILILAVGNLFADVTPTYLKIIGLVAIALPMLLIACLTNGFGGADVKLMAAAGLFLGVGPIIIAFFIGGFLGAIYGIYLLATKQGDRKTAFAFCPFLNMGIAISLFFAQPILNWYLGFFR